MTPNDVPNIQDNPPAQLGYILIIAAGSLAAVLILWPFIAPMLP